ncbi:MAG: acyl-CoA thioesterase [Fidelibacterota bacterium]
METQNLQRTDFDFWTTIQTRWRDMDALGHLNHTAYLTYMETARVDLFIQLGYSGIKKEMDESAILGAMDVQYWAQVTHPAQLEIGHRIIRIGSKSYDLLGIAFLGDNVVCSVIFKMVSFNYKMNKAIPVPDKIRENCRPL